MYHSLSGRRAGWRDRGWRRRVRCSQHRANINGELIVWFSSTQHIDMALQIRNACQVTSEFGLEMTVWDDSPVWFEWINVLLHYLHVHITNWKWKDNIYTSLILLTTGGKTGVTFHSLTLSWILSLSLSDSNRTGIWNPGLVPGKCFNIAYNRVLMWHMCMKYAYTYKYKPYKLTLLWASVSQRTMK